MEYDSTKYLAYKQYFRVKSIEEIGWQKMGKVCQYK